MGRYQKVRNEVGWFANQMERKLRVYDREKGERGWKRNDVAELFERLEDEVAELGHIIHTIYSVPACGLEDMCAQAMEECADIGNFAMMIADRLSQQKVVI